MQSAELNVASIRRALDSTGVAVLNDCDLEQLEVLARSYGEVRSPWKKLVPQDARTADSWSLSGMFGLGAFPWHTDGAVSPRSPSVVLLYCRQNQAVEACASTSSVNSSEGFFQL